MAEKAERSEPVHISKVDGKYPVAFKPNNIILNTKDRCSALEKQLLMVLFVVPAMKFPKSRQLSIDISMITTKPLKGSIYDRLKVALDNITDAKFEVYQDDAHYGFINVFEKAFRDGDNIISLITQSAIDVIREQMSNGFTMMSLGDTIRLTTGYQFVFLEYILRYNGYKSPSILLVDIKRRLGIPTDKYSRWIHFKQRIAESSINSLNKILGYNIKLIPEKTGNKNVKFSLITGGHQAKEEGQRDDFNLRCFNLLPTNEREKYTNKIPEFVKSETVALITSVDFFAKDHRQLLEASNSPDEFIENWIPPTNY